MIRYQYPKIGQIKNKYMEFHRFYWFFWNASVDRKYYWICKMFWNRICISFKNGEEPLRVKDLWLNANGDKSRDKSC